MLAGERIHYSEKVFKMSELTIAEQAEKQKQESMDMLHVGKFYPDAKKLTFRGEDVFVSGEITTHNFKDIEFFEGNTPGLSKATVCGRLYQLVKKRPGRPAIRIYSRILYGFSVGHLVRLANDMSPKRVMGTIGHVLKSQESVRPLPKAIRVG